MFVTKSSLFRHAATTAALFLGLVPASSALARQENPLPNPGFEGAFQPVAPQSDSDNKKADIQGELASGWGDNSNWADVTLRYARETKDAHSGGTAQRVKVVGVRSGAVQFVSARVPLKQGEVYQFRVWLKGENGTNVEMNLRQAGAPYKTYASRSYLLGGGWREYEVAGIATDTTEGFLMIRVTAPGEFLIDDASFDNLTQKVSDAPGKVGNLLSNASFEAGDPEDGAVWAAGGWSTRFRSVGSAANAARFAYQDPRPRRDTQSPAAVGKGSLRLEIPKGGAALVQSPPFRFNYGKPHTVSLWMKASRANAGASLELHGASLSQSFALTTEWKRYTFTGTPTYRTSTYLTVNSEAANEPLTVWVDGVQVEERSEASPAYIPNAPVELLLGSDCAGHVYHDGEKLALWARISGSAAGGSIAVLKMEVRDLGGKVTAIKPVPVRLQDAGQNVAVVVPPMNVQKLRGMFKVRATLITAAGKPLSAPAECVYAVLPKPRVLRAESSFFGVHIPLAPDYIALSLATGHRWARLHDASMIAKWAGTEPEKGAWNWTDEGVTAAKRSGMAILGLLDGAPAWTTTQPREGYWGFWNIPDKPGAADDWSNYVRTTVAHYKGRIDHWEVWNEPWGQWWAASGNPNATPQYYGELLKRANKEAHAANPNVTIVGIDSYRSADDKGKWTQNALTAAPPANFDGFSFHLYDGSLMGGPTPNARVEADYFHAAQKFSGGPVRPLWNTEGGPGDIATFYAPEAGGMPITLQAAYAVRYDVTMMASGVKHYFLYAVHSDPALEDTGFQAAEYDRAIRPILGARAVLASLVDGAKCLGRTAPVPGVDAYLFDDAQTRQRITVVWSFDGDKHTVTIPKAARVRDVWGNPLSSPGGKITVGNEPIYFVLPKT